MQQERYPNPLDRLDELEARQRHPAGKHRDYCPHTGKSLPQHIPAVDKQSRTETVVIAILMCSLFIVGVYIVAMYLTGNAT